MLWYAAPLLAFARTIDVPSRLRCTLALVVGIPLVLAAVHLLTWWALFVAAAICCYLRFRFSEAVQEFEPWDGVAAAFTLLIASPNIVRPPLEGDSLAYHLPNAMAWVQSGSFDPTWMRYWWYPPGAEIAVAGMIAAGGLWIAGVPSLLAAMMLATRMGSWLRGLDVPPATATAIVVAFMTITTVAFQTYDERNDLVLAAWFVESLWMLRESNWRAMLPVAVLSLIKPDGWIYAVVAIGCMGKPRAIIALIPVELWLLHVVLLAPHAQISIAATSFGSPWTTMIAGNLPASLTVLSMALLGRGPAIVCFFLGPFVALFGSGEERRAGIAGIFAILLFAFTPFSYANNLPQLALGTSLRFALPALAAGAIGLAPLARAASAIVGVLGVVSAVAGFVRLLFLTAGDAITPIGVACAAIVLVAAGVAFAPNMRRVAAITATVATLALFLFGANVASAQVTSFYRDVLPKVAGRSTGFFAWYRAHPHDAEAININAGMLLTLAPDSRIIDGQSVDCARAAIEGAWIVAVAGDRRLDDARRCGSVLFQDADIVVTVPNPNRAH